MAEDPDSGRRDYLISRNTLLDVTDLTMASVRVSDPRVASVMDGVVAGHIPGTVNITVRLSMRHMNCPRLYIFNVIMVSLYQSHKL